MFFHHLAVVVDRKFDRSCDIGRFELAYKQPLVTVPPYIGVSLCVEGQAVKKPNWAVRPNKETEAGRLNELPSSGDSLFMPRAVTTRMTVNNEQLPVNGKNPYSTITIANTPSGHVGSADTSHIKRNVVRIPDVMIKTLLAQSSRVAKDGVLKANTNTHRSPGEVDKVKDGTRTRSFIPNNNEAANATTDQKGNHEGDEAAKQVKRQTVKNNESASTNMATPRTGDVTNSMAAQNGCVAQQTQQHLNPPCTPGTNRRFPSKSSASSNITTPAVAGTERTSQSQITAASSTKSTDLQVCKPNSKGRTSYHKLLSIPPRFKQLKQSREKRAPATADFLLPYRSSSVTISFPVSHSAISTDKPKLVTAPTIPVMPTRLNYFKRLPENRYSLDHYLAMKAMLKI